MSRLLFKRSMSTLELFDQQQSLIASYVAANFVDSHSHGAWPAGTFHFQRYDPHAADGPEGAYGSNGIFIFEVPGREGMGVHSGRQDVADGLGRKGYQHCTMGCIRTTDEATARIKLLNVTDLLAAIVVV